MVAHRGASAVEAEHTLAAYRRALDDGASVLVIGRPITGAADPARTIAEIAGSLNKEVIE